MPSKKKKLTTKSVKSLKKSSSQLRKERQIQLAKTTSVINEKIGKFLRKPKQSFNSSWSSMIPIYSACFTKLIKMKIQGVPNSLQSIKKLGWNLRLQKALNIAAAQNNTIPLHVTIGFFIDWYNEQTKKK